MILGYESTTWVLSAGAFLAMIGISIVAPILPLYAREFGVSRAAAGGLISAFAVARLVFDLLGGGAVDRIGTRRMMSAGAVLVIVSSVLAALAPTYGILVVARVLEGAGSAAFALAANVYLIVTVPRERRGRTMALFQTGLLGGISVGPFVGGRAAEIGDFTTPFWIYAGVGVALLGLVTFFVTDDGQRTATKLADTYRAAGRLLRDPRYWVLIFVTFSIFVMRGGARVTLLPLYAGEELALSPGAIGEIIAIGAIVNMLAVNPVGRLVDGIGRRPVLVFGLIASGIAVGVTGYVHSYVALLALTAVYGAVHTFAAVPPPTLAGDLAPAGLEGASVSLYRVAGDIGLIVGPVLLGSVADTGAFVGAFWIAGVLTIIAGFASIVFRDSTPQRRP